MTPEKEKQIETLVKAIQDEINNLVKEDVNWLQGYLIAASQDNCIDLPDGWKDFSKEKLVELAAKAYVKCAEKIMNGEILPSEMNAMGRLH